MTAHADPPAPVRPALSWALIPALLACLAAPAFFVLQVAWVGWILLAAALGGAWLLERRGGGASLRRREADEPPSLLRDLSLIALGQLKIGRASGRERVGQYV